MTYSEAIEKVMIDNYGFAPLKLIYQNIGKYRQKTGQTPDNTIQERVQRDDKFIRIELGVYALAEYSNKLPKAIKPKNKAEKKAREHASIQGMLLEIGNYKQGISGTYTNDKKWVFGKQKLGNIATLKKVPPFTYKNIIEQSVKFADVIWFNERDFPNSIFEVEHSTDFSRALIKFVELQDFMVKFCCVAPENRKNKFNRELNKSAFNAVANRVQFRTYQQIENDYQHTLKETYL